VLDEEDEVVVERVVDETDDVVVTEPEDVEVLDDVVVDEPGDVEAVVELDEVEVEDNGVLDELEEDVVKNVVDDHIVLDEEASVRKVEEEPDELEGVDDPETNVTALISDDS
jgi:hypothetical protein